MAKKKNIRDNLLFQLIPLFFLPFIFLLVKNEMLITLVFVVLLVLTFLIKYEKGEWKILLFGILLGIFLELAGDVVFKLQFWENASFFGIPFWLPLMWGYEVVFVRRISVWLLKK
jgi:hypothetical protein